MQLEDDYGNTPLALCMINGVDWDGKSEVPEKLLNKRKMVRLLVEHGADVNVRNSKNGFTPIHWAARYGEVENIKVLCEQSKMEICEFMPDFNGYTPLDFAGKF